MNPFPRSLKLNTILISLLQLLNGSPSTLLSSQNGRKSLERSLEKFFSVWVWSWDLEAGGNGSPSSHLNESSGRETFAETISGK